MFLLKIFRPKIKQYFYDTLISYAEIAKSKESLTEVKTFLIEIIDEVITDYVNKYKIK